MATEKVFYGYGVRWKIPETNLHHVSDFHTFHEAAVFASGSTYAELFLIVDGDQADVLAVSVNGEWLVEEDSPMAHMFNNGEYEDARGSDSVVDDLLGDDPSPSSSSKKEKTVKKDNKKAAKPAKTAKNEKSAKTAKNEKSAKKETATRSRSTIDPKSKIKILTPDYEGREGTRQGDTWNKLKEKNGAIVQKFIDWYEKTKFAKQVPTMQILHYFARKGHVKFI